MKLSIIIPVFNEEKTITKILEKVVRVKFVGIEKEIIVVDDGSTDATATKIKNHTVAKLSASKSKIKSLKVFFHNKNLGKGAAIRTGIQNASGDYIVIQDADLEYNPQDITRLIKPILEGKAEVVYGTRIDKLPDFKKEQKTIQFFIHYLGNRFLSLITSIIYFQWITDMETCYKIFPKKAATYFKLKARGFEFEPEITAKLLKKGYKIHELPINVTPRSYKEGKKINSIKDGLKALWALFKYRFVD